MRGANKDCCTQKLISRVGKPAGESYECFLEYFDCGQFYKAALSIKSHGLLKLPHKQCRIMLLYVCSMGTCENLLLCIVKWISAGASQIKTISPVTPIASCFKEDVTTSPPFPNLVHVCFFSLMKKFSSIRLKLLFVWSLLLIPASTCWETQLLLCFILRIGDVKHSVWACNSFESQSALFLEMTQMFQKWIVTII